MSLIHDPAAVARCLYDAMARSDAAALLELLTDDFVGTVSTGMPHGVGGTHYGPHDMVAGVWGRIASIYRMHVDANEYLPVDDHRVVVLGRYRGVPTTGTRPSTRRSHMSSPPGVIASRNCSRSPTPRGGAFRQPRDAVAFRRR